jgi:D-arabinose 1-dehydrogenase-like Zn-dependent alcohol dehydrogenase
MRAVGEPLSIEDVPAPQIGPDEVLVESHTSGICGTDLHILAGHGYVPALPHILGHEPAGVVAEVGRNVTDIRPGDRVVPHLFFSCNRCRLCRSGRQQQCSDLRGILGVLCPGAFAEYFKAPAENLFRLPDSVSFEAGGLIADAVVTGLHAVRRANPQLGESAAVLGVGGVGQIIVQALAANGVRIVAIDRSPEKLGIARDMGAALSLPADSPDLVEAVQGFSNAGVDCVFNCVGTAASMRLAADLVIRCGRIVVIGEEAEFPALDTTEIAQRELQVIGSRNGTRQDMADAIRLVEAGVLKPLVAARFPLEDINAAFRLVREGARGRVVVTIRNLDSKLKQ